MKVLFFIISLSLFIFNNSYAVELIDCSKFDKQGALYLDCKSKNLKSKLNEGQSKTKEKIKSTALKTKKKFSESKLGKMLNKLKTGNLKSSN